ncbi:hypothetical protein HHI36_013181 [Cryptolaemus montrouzieri]|uniref:Uncharacterized protein n=1 Tax=Cryptolaemus montrouzieri TaxID=559131 RepID=A0ABD2NGZ7_9CUCU
MTLRRYVIKYREDCNHGVETNFVPKFTTKQIFNKDEEDMLASYLKKASQLHHGLGTLGARENACKFAVRNTKSYSAKWDHNKFAGYDWLEVSIRTPEQQALLDLVRSIGKLIYTKKHRINPNMFTDDDFLHASVTDRPMNESRDGIENPSIKEPDGPSTSRAEIAQRTNETSTSSSVLQPSKASNSSKNP